jgi:glucose-1-phosphate cytidylyltransferase
MKAVILAGGLGTRMREETEFRPKPMVEIGGKPVLWHLMKILSKQGIREFIILAGYRVDYIKNYFLDFSAHLNDFTIENGTVHFHNENTTDEKHWKISVLDTGVETLTSERILKAKSKIGSDAFICTYGDGLANIDITKLLENHRAGGRIASMTVYQPENRFGVVEFDHSNQVNAFKEKPKMTDWINIGFFVFEPGIWNYLKPGVPLEEDPLKNLSDDKQLTANTHEGFWMPMDTYREYVALSDLWTKGQAPWATWLV